MSDQHVKEVTSVTLKNSYKGAQIIVAGKGYDRNYVLENWQFFVLNGHASLFEEGAEAAAYLKSRSRKPWIQKGNGLGGSRLLEGKNGRASLKLVEKPKSEDKAADKSPEWLKKLEAKMSAISEEAKTERQLRAKLQQELDSLKAERAAGQSQLPKPKEPQPLPSAQQDFQSQLKAKQEKNNPGKA